MVTQPAFMCSNISDLSLHPARRSRTSGFHGLVHITISPWSVYTLDIPLDTKADRARQLFRRAEHFQALGELIGTAG